MALLLPRQLRLHLRELGLHLRQLLLVSNTLAVECCHPLGKLLFILAAHVGEEQGCTCLVIAQRQA